MAGIITVLAGIAVALIAGLVISAQKQLQKWHDGDKWQALLDLDHRRAAKQYSGCDSRLLQSRFGITQVYACGNPSNPPIFLFHGMGTSSVMWGDWVVPKLRHTHYVVAVDALCDIGRSRPKDGDTTNCPNSQAQAGEWFLSMKQELIGTGSRASLVGYSYGSFLSSQIALAAPEAVHKVVLIAPSGIFAPLEFGWVMRAILVMRVGGKLAPNLAFKERLLQWFYSYMSPDSRIWENPDMKETWEQRLATFDLGQRTHLIAGDPTVLDVETLRLLNKHNPVLLVVGQNETLINATLAVETATAAGISVQMYKDSGHLMLVEHPREPMADVVGSFLTDSEKRER